MKLLLSFPTLCPPQSLVTTFLLFRLSPCMKCTCERLLAPPVPHSLLLIQRSSFHPSHRRLIVFCSWLVFHCVCVSCCFYICSSVLDSALRLSVYLGNCDSGTITMGTWMIYILILFSVYMSIL